MVLAAVRARDDDVAGVATDATLREVEQDQ